MNYEEMSDLEINRNVATTLGHKLNDGVSHEHDVGCFEGCEQEFHALVGEPGNGDSFDYCNNPSDAWPIIVGNKIAILPNAQGNWLSYGWAKWNGKQDFSPRKEDIDKNPLRAAMICFLKMKDAENGKH